MSRLIVGISGASGAIYGVRLLETLAGRDDVDTHLVVTRGAEATLLHETGRSLDELRSLADHAYGNEQVGAPPASGTFLTDGMVVAPCSIKTLSAVANSYADSLVSRAADVCLKERRPLVLVVRETPLHLGHLRLMEAVTELGAVVLPPVPAFYLLPKTIDDLVDHTVTKVLDQFGLGDDLAPRWGKPGTGG